MGIVMSILIAALWRFVSDLSSKFDKSEHDRNEIRNQLHKIEINYRTKADAAADVKIVLDAVNRLADKVDKLNDKLDRKADK